jgi:hypothetical protein
MPPLAQGQNLEPGSLRELCDCEQGRQHLLLGGLSPVAIAPWPNQMDNLGEPNHRDMQSIVQVNKPIYRFGIVHLGTICR